MWIRVPNRCEPSLAEDRQVFGPERRAILEHRLAGADNYEAEEPKSRASGSGGIRPWTATLTTLSSRLYAARCNDFEAQRIDLAAKLTAVRRCADLLRTLFEVVQLHAQIHDQGEQGTLTVTSPAEHEPEIAGTAERIHEQKNPQEQPGANATALVGFWSVPPVRFELTLDGF